MAFIALPNGEQWTGPSGVFHLTLECLWRHTSEPRALVEALDFGVNSGTKYCSLEKCAQEDLLTFRRLVERFSAELPTIRPDFSESQIAQGITELDRLLALLPDRAGAE